jgi:hypothetical protein
LLASLITQVALSSWDRRAIVGFLQAPDYSRAVSHIADLPAAERRQQLLQAVRLSLLHAGATNTNKFASPQQFKKTLLQFAAQRQVRDQIRKGLRGCLDDDHQ